MHAVIFYAKWYSVFTAPVAQWIEQIRPKDKMWVRFLLGAPCRGTCVGQNNTVYTKTYS